MVNLLLIVNEITGYPSTFDAYHLQGSSYTRVFQETVM